MVRVSTFRLTFTKEIGSFQKLTRVNECQSEQQFQSSSLCIVAKEMKYRGSCLELEIQLAIIFVIILHTSVRSD